MNATVSLRRLSLRVGSGDPMDVRRFRVSERMNGLFEVTVTAVCPSPDVDLDACVEGPASFTAHAHSGSSRTWSGVASRARLVRAEEQGLSTYEVTIVPRLWLLGQNLDYRIFQHLSEIDVVLSVLGKWGVSRRAQLSSAYKKRKYRAQYGESDLAFVCRMLEDCGVSFHFEDDTMVLSDAPQEGSLRGPIPFRAEPAGWQSDHVTDLQIERALRPGRVTLRDHDYRRPPQYALVASADGAGGLEAGIERYSYAPGAFLFESDRGESTPFADDKGKYRVDEAEASRLASVRLSGHRAGAKTVTFRTNAIDLGPGTVVCFSDHPSAELGSGHRYLITAVEIEGTHDGEWTQVCRAASGETAHHPEARTPRPKVNGVESATVVGPPGEEIHTDEFGRVRVHFHWDREGKMDDRASCWIHVSQPWSGSGYGALNLPRVGQEVIVDFLGGDPDRPVIVGRVHTNLQKVPYKLPEAKTQTVFRSQSTRGKDGYNEIRYEDQAGSELFRVQAERDYSKLVKNDDRVVIGNDREEEVKRDERHVIGRDREHAVMRDRKDLVGRDKDERVGHDRTRAVQNDESVTVGNNLDFTVVNNERRFVGNSRSTEVAEDESLRVGGHRREAVKMTLSTTVGLEESAVVGGARSRAVGGVESVKIGMSSERSVGGSDTLSVGGARTKTVGAAETITIGGARTTTIATTETVTIAGAMTRTIGLALQESVGGVSNLSVGISRAAEIGQTDAVSAGKAFSVSVGKKGGAATTLAMSVDKIALGTPGGASITLEGDTITLDANHVVIHGAEDVKATAETLLQLKSTGGDVVIRGGPMVKINT